MGVDLAGVNLTGANLHSVILTDANLANANLTDATLTEVHLAGTNLAGANLTGAILTNISGSGQYDIHTIFPPEFNPASHRNSIPVMLAGRSFPNRPAQRFCWLAWPAWGPSGKGLAGRHSPP